MACLGVMAARSSAVYVRNGVRDRVRILLFFPHHSRLQPQTESIPLLIFPTPSPQASDALVF